MKENSIEITDEGKAFFSPKSLSPGESQVFIYKKNTISYEIFLIRVNKKFQKIRESLFAFKNICPHQKIPLDFNPGIFLNYDKNAIQCSTHGALFRIEDGYCFRGPCVGKFLEKVKFMIKNDIIIFSVNCK